MKQTCFGKSFIGFIMVLLGISGLLACSSGGGGGGGGSTPAASKATVSGQVTGSGGIEDVKVSAGAVSTTTDENGFYLLKDAAIPSTRRLVITFEKDGYATYQKSVMAEAGKIYAVSAKLAVYDINESSMDQTIEQALEAPAASDGKMKGRLELPANSLSGAAAGNVKVSMAVGDPSTEAGRQTFPGDYMAAESAGEEPNTPLISLAFGEITIKDSDGNKITNLTKPATVTLRLPDEFQTGGANYGVYDPNNSEKDSIEWWSYDETNGTWLREDADLSTTDVVDDAQIVEIDGILYAKGQVMHFSWWNADKPISTHACLCAEIVDGNDSPMQGIEMFAEGVSYNGTSYPAQSDARGKACVNVLRSTDDKMETVTISARSGNVEFTYNVTAETEGEIATDLVNTPMQQGSTRDNSGTCLDLANKITVSFDGMVQGTVTNENTGLPAANFTIYSDFGPNVETNSNGVYQMNVPLNVPILLYAPGLASKAVTVTDENIPGEVNFVIPNKAPKIKSFTRSPNTGTVSNGNKVTFTTVATDEDGDALTYSYTASAGSPTSGTGSTFQWTAPATGTGSAEISVTVSDGNGGEDSSKKIVPYGGAVGGTSLKIVVKDDHESDQPVEGVYVILHANDNKTVEETLTTGADGTANFGNIGRASASFTVAFEKEQGVQGESWMQRNIDTFVDVPVGDIVYYIASNSDGEHYSWCQTSIANINVALEDVPAAVNHTNLSPIYGYSMDNRTFTNVSVCPEQVQSNGKLSIIASGMSGPELNSYTFLTDQTITEGATYTLPGPNDTSGWRTPLQSTWSTDPSTPLTSVYVSGERGGIDYYEIGAYDSFSGAQTGTISLRNEFPVDQDYWVTGTSVAAANGTVLHTSKGYGEMAQTLSIPMPDFSIDALDYDGASKLFSWAVSGNTEKDVVVLDLAYSSGEPDYSEASWTIALSPSAASWAIPDLPSPVSGWTGSGDINRGSLMVFDFDVVSGLDETWALFIQGFDPENESNRIFRATRDLEITQNLVRAAARRNPDTEVSQESVRKQLRPFSRLIRR